MSATRPFASFVVNLGRVTNIPPGEKRTFRIGARAIAVLRKPDGKVIAAASESTQTYPAAIDQDGHILVDVEQLLPVLR